MSSLCDKCTDKQYCKDCRKETEEDLIEDLEPLESSHWRKQSCKKVSICGGHLFYKGICYEILYKEDIEEKNGSPNIIFRTQQGLTFYLREQKGGELVFIKVVKSPPKKVSCKAEKSELRCLEKNLLGQIPEGLIANNTW
ncbi:hypothetical protein A3J98_01570 [candidate division WS6 bacterium RIFOXYC1_FULL_33_10]|uniref:Uncharacterized protein n=1 Tax=candidate division WS6 bacterium RIFOXYC1_FULL_33_10 TaxID=1802606 RepID=A0A1F4UJA4_9BACT|nr:MAG: hypothetical protein A3J98_01570 [candidate division WS6 bacterium RIFOXYC1_FULL_33_10]